MNGACFSAYVEHFLGPTLREGNVIVTGNLRSYKIACVRDAIERVGAMLRDLPAYSPDLNPIEQPSQS
jgi:transposase